jgi:L-histidine Nalpha-methyltransferase
MTSAARLHDDGDPFARRPVSPRARMLRDVAEGLSRPQKELSPTYFYDTRGSELFAEITRLPEYYLTRAERALLRSRIPALIDELRPATLVELGAGNADKTRIILDAMHGAQPAPVYVPIDVSADFLDDTAARLRAEYPALQVVPVIGDISEAIEPPSRLPSPTLFAFLGSTIGNFAPPAAVTLLRRVRAAMRPGDAFLLGADLRKDVAVIEAAYNDSRGVTAEFNRNVLRVLDRELGADFDPDAFDHVAFYAPVEHRIEMHLVARRAQQVTIPGIGTIDFRAGESIRTEISTKYDRAAITRLLDCAGLQLAHWITDEQETFSLSVATR